ncbi:MAG: HAMP domain-containing sensor histidine kinase, partial [Actinomycetota bacterium]
TMLWSASGRSSTGAAALEPEAVVSSSDVLKMAQSMLAGGDVTRSGWVSLALTGDVERSVEFTLVYAGDRFVLEFVERTDELKARSTLASVNATTEAHRSFLSRVSHEMRSPLNVIHGYSQLLGRLQLPEAAVGYVASIDRGVGRMVQIVDDLLLLGQLDQGLLTLDNQLVTVDELLARLMVALPDEPWWIDGAVTRIETAPQDTRVRTDPSRWCTAVALVLEASRNIAPHEALELGAFVRGGRAGMQVVARSDSAVVDELWVPFAKSHTIPGAGLGLAVARGIMRVLGADTDVRPSPVDSSRTSLVLTVPPAD